MGITMIDLYDGPNNPFRAGMDFGDGTVTLFSFH